jgi:KipI family sensor histidine kinase inhibitor
MDLRFLVSGDTAVVVEFGNRVDRELSDRVVRLSAAVRAARIAGVVETVPTYRSLMIQYDPLITDGASVIAAAEKLLEEGSVQALPAKLWRIPACYAESHAPDLAEVAQRTSLGLDEVVRVVTETTFHVYMVGFSPGLPYMGDLPKALALPRRVDPRVKVRAGSIATAVGMTVVYPVESPGGWHLIGATPVRLFDVRSPRPALLSPGDKVRFEPITVGEFEDIRAAVAADAYQVPCETIPA